jgi:hypothetical protein
MPLQISTRVALPSGITLENRLVKVAIYDLNKTYRFANSDFKAAMTEGLANSAHLPDENAIRAYSNWADGGWGLIITGTTSALL